MVVWRLQFPLLNLRAYQYGFRHAMMLILDLEWILRSPLWGERRRLVPSRLKAQIKAVRLEISLSPLGQVV